MPTSKPRITVTLTEQQYDLLSGMSSLGSGSMSSIVADLVETMVPVLERVVSTLRAAANAPIEMREAMRLSFAKAEDDLRPHVDAVMGVYDELLPPVAQVSAQRVPAPPVAIKPSAAKSARPPTSNRGVSSPPKSSKSSANSPMKTIKKPGSQKK